VEKEIERRVNLKESGKCVVCRVKPAREGKKLCAACTEKMNENRIKARKNGMCGCCQAKPAQEGMARCVACTVKRREKRADLKESGKCVVCRVKPAQEGRVQCVACTERKKIEYREKRSFGFHSRTWMNKQYKRKAMRILGGLFCRCCGESMLIYLALDHVLDDGAECRKDKSGSGSGIYRRVINGTEKALLQVLCFNCNMAKRCNRGRCPRTNKYLLEPATAQEMYEMRTRLIKEGKLLPEDAGGPYDGCEDE
jgi:hypothetical protein